ncbi:hypothetical protein [Spirosoma aerolatum]|uniref:hypothetical protein n=1 Tax=Spirosoma aerolatum TaxID=1211326 RepID=UPI0009ABB376|nr:hypothetical protein [Spirosoma aerolatum]
MIHTTHPYTPFFPPGPATPTRKRPTNDPLFNDDRPPQPDWLLILMCALFLLTLFLAWYVDIPRLLH